MTDPGNNSSSGMYGVPGLEKFIDRLKPGMNLEGRIINILADNIVVLRVWGNNILTESNYPFKKYDEIILHVQTVRPKLVFSIRPAHLKGNGAIYA